MARFQIDSLYLNEIKELILKEDKKSLKRKLKSIHYADLAEIIESISINHATYLIKLLGSEKTADALADVEADGYSHAIDETIVGNDTVPAGTYSDIHCEEHGDHDH